MYKVAIFSSGNGTNAENISLYFANNQNIKISIILSNNSHAVVLNRAARLGIPAATFSRENFDDGEPILRKLTDFDIDFIVLAGFMNKISDKILQRYPHRIFNIHPALLPKHGGKGMYGMHVHEAVVADGDKESGITIHYINKNYDEGEILFQAKCPVLPTDKPEDVAAKVHALEYKYYPKIIERVILGKNLQETT